VPSEHNHAADMESPLALAALFYPAKSKRDFSLLKRFAEARQAEGVRVGGLVQESLTDDAGCRVGIDAIELDTGRRVAINRPTREHLASQACSLDPSALTDATSALRRAIDQRMDLIVVEKFGEQEQEGRGLADDILQAVSEGIPTIVAVPDSAAEIWANFSGGLAQPLAYEMDALENWWRSVISDAP